MGKRFTIYKEPIPRSAYVDHDLQRVNRTEPVKRCARILPNGRRCRKKILNILPGEPAYEFVTYCENCARENPVDQRDYRRAFDQAYNCMRVTSKSKRKGVEHNGWEDASTVQEMPT